MQDAVCLSACLSLSRSRGTMLGEPGREDSFFSFQSLKEGAHLQAPKTQSSTDELSAAAHHGLEF